MPLRPSVRNQYGAPAPPTHHRGIRHQFETVGRQERARSRAAGKRVKDQANRRSAPPRLLHDRQPTAQDLNHVCRAQSSQTNDLDFIRSEPRQAVPESQGNAPGAVTAPDLALSVLQGGTHEASACKRGVAPSLLVMTRCSLVIAFMNSRSALRPCAPHQPPLAHSAARQSQATASATQQ